MKTSLEKLKAYALPLLILLVGIALMLLTSGGGQKDSGETSLCEALSLTRGVGEAYVLVSDNGVVVVCEGAQDAATRMEIVRAVKTYTGFGADRITVLKMKSNEWEERHDEKQKAEHRAACGADVRVCGSPAELVVQQPVGEGGQSHDRRRG